MKPVGNELLNVIRKRVLDVLSSNLMRREIVSVGTKASPNIWDMVMIVFWAILEYE